MRRSRQRGSSLLEFTLVGIPALFLLASTVQVGQIMWNYHTLARAVNAGARLASLRGAGCAAASNTCSITVDTIATTISTAAVGIPPGNFNVTLTTQSGVATSCSPLNSCFGSVSVWPPSSGNDNQVGNNVIVSASYQFPSALAVFWPGHRGVPFGTVNLPAISTQRILF